MGGGISGVAGHRLAAGAGHFGYAAVTRSRVARDERNCGHRRPFGEISELARAISPNVRVYAMLAAGIMCPQGDQPTIWVRKIAIPSKI